MGVCMGLLVLRKSEGQNLEKEGGCFTVSRANWFVKQMFDNYPMYVCGKKSQEDLDQESSQKSWRSRVDWNMLFYNLSMIVFIVLHAVYNYHLDYWKTADGKDPEHLPWEVFNLKTGQYNVYYQFIMVHYQLMIVVGLCCDGGLSYTSRFFRTKVMQVDT